MNRRDFLAAACNGAAMFCCASIAGRAAPLAARQPKRPPRLKHWAWMRGDFKSLDDWQRKLAEMRAAGIEAVLVTGNADFYRAHIPAATNEGVEVHAWIMTMMRGENVKAHPEWYAVSRAGVSTAEKAPYVDYYKFMCPAREEVRSYLAAFVRDLARIDGLASIHLDYIRYPDVILPVALWPKYHLVQDKEYPEFDFCYCSVCRDRFRRASGIDPLKIEDPPASRAWLQYRYDTITEVVSRLAAEAHAQKKLLTAAVFPTPTIARTLVRQEWTKWNVDAVLPMAYHAFYKEDVPWIERATREGVEGLRGRIPLYTGVYVPDLTPPDLARAATHALAGGANGICLFQGNTLTPEHWKAIAPVLKGVTA